MFEATACSIPAWAWNVSAPLLSLYSYHLFGPEDVEWPLDVMQPPTVRQAASMSAGCGARFASQTAAARWIEALPLLPGHVLRLCGALKKLLASDDLIALSVAGGNVLGAACTYTNFTPAQCLQYFIPPLLTHTSRMLRPISGDILGAYHCMVLAQPWGKIACTRDSNTGEEMPTYGLSLQDPLGQAVKEPVVALAVSKDFACAVLAVSYGLAGWGSLPRGEYIFNMFRPWRWDSILGAFWALIQGMGRWGVKFCCGGSAYSALAMTQRPALPPQICLLSLNLLLAMVMRALWLAIRAWCAVGEAWTRV